MRFTTVNFPIKGVRVRVYKDPLTRHEMEGVARVVRRLSYLPDQDGIWSMIVRFSGPNQYNVQRYIHKDDIDV